MLNERAYVDRWTECVRRANCFDQIVVVDGGSTDGTSERLCELGIPVISRAFQNHFSEQRNFAAEQCSNDWIFELDADEIPSQPLFAGLQDIVRDAERAEMDCVGIARFNFLDGTLVAGPGWKGLDYQYRLHSKNCRWRGAVHEELTGYRCRYELKIDDGHFLIHDKTRERYEAQNNYYRTLTP